MTETKTCRECGRELPISSFRKTRWGSIFDTRNECVKEKYLATRNSNRPQRPTPAYSDPEFDGQSVGDVFRMMGRAKRWLESRGCTIKLEGEYTETKTHKLKY